MDESTPNLDERSSITVRSDKHFVTLVTNGNRRFSCFYGETGLSDIDVQIVCNPQSDRDCCSFFVNVSNIGSFLSGSQFNPVPSDGFPHNEIGCGLCKDQDGDLYSFERMPTNLHRECYRKIAESIEQLVNENTELIVQNEI